MDVIETTKLTKKFGDLVAVNEVSLKVKEGEIFGLLGPNGAGKTTLISMLVTMKKPSSGMAFVNGFDVVKESDEVRKSIGVVFQDPSLDEDLTAYENLELHAAMYGLAKAEREKRIIEVIEMVELKDMLNNLVKTFSGGMRRRLEIARALLHYPKILFLDEPTLGLDPQTRAHVWEYIHKLKKEHGITILVTTHYMDEADNNCDRIAIIDHGKIIALDTPASLKDSLGGDNIEIETESIEKLKIALKRQTYIKNIKMQERKVILTVLNGERCIPKIMDAARRARIKIDSISLREPTLDDVFMHYTGKNIRDEVVSPSESFRIRKRAMSARMKR
jgi:ABC-2 type transport system ATP-binding protein